jgi:hypothetical protein
MYLHVEERIMAFAALSAEIKQIANKMDKQPGSIYNDLLFSIANNNPWFTFENVKQSLLAIAELLTENELRNWLKDYDLKQEKSIKTVGVVMAGNIPAVGFHDAICVLMSGNKLLAKLSSQDLILIPFLFNLLIKINPKFKDSFEFTTAQLINIDAIIATGNNNTSRYFEYYFSKYPNIIRKNRTSIAVISGNETNEELLNLWIDVLSYFGLGCRNVSKIYFPNDWNPKQLLDVSLKYDYLKNHSKYYNNYEYNKALYLINGVEHLDNGFLLLKEDESLHAPIGVLYYETYQDLQTLKNKLITLSPEIQCVVSSAFSGISNVSFGFAQQPKLSDYADGIDTMEFLIKLDN